MCCPTSPIPGKTGKTDHGFQSLQNSSPSSPKHLEQQGSSQTTFMLRKYKGFMILPSITLNQNGSLQSMLKKNILHSLAQWWWLLQIQEEQNWQEILHDVLD